MNNYNRITIAAAAWIVALTMACTALIGVAGTAAAADDTTVPAPQEPAAGAQQAEVQENVSLYLPRLLNDFGYPATRIGYNTLGPATEIPAARTLNAGWYTSWEVYVKPPRPGGMEFIQTIRVHQKLACGQWFHADRTACPYAQPLDYVFRPDTATIQQAVQANPGAVWVIGNEIDRIDWKDGTAYTGQDEILPATYARAYHDLYNLVKTTDPTAKIAIGGVIQATPLRLKYLTQIWDAYKSQYGVDMPVDVWNVHSFILREKRGEYGADIPPGLTEDTGSYIGDDSTHINHTIFDQQIRAMRQWMKDRGQQEKPLYVTEYGVLYAHCVQYSKGKCTLDLNNSQLVVDYMLWTFDYFQNTQDCSLGYTADSCRLVQRWAWLALNSNFDVSNSNNSAMNKWGSLFNATSTAIMPAGQAFAEYVTKNVEVLRSAVP